MKEKKNEKAKQQGMNYSFIRLHIQLIQENVFSWRMEAGLY